MSRRMHGLPAVGSPMLVALVLIAAIAAHLGAWHLMSRHWGLSGALAATLIAIAVVKHLGWISGAYALLRRRRASRAIRPRATP